MLKSTKISFSSWKSIFSRAAESVRDVGGFDEAAPLEELVNNLEKDISEWSLLS